MLTPAIPLTVFADDTDTTFGDITTDTENGENNDIPTDDEEEIDLSAAVDVDGARALYLELSAGTPVIRITASFEVDRTFYVTSDAIIFTDEACTLTRAPGFGGDIFVVGEDENGVITEGVKFTLGNPLTNNTNMLIIDGNAAAMTSKVVGSVIFASEKTQVNLYPAVTIKNAVKVGNERVLNHTVSYHSRVGGAVAIITSKASMNIYGGSYFGNRTNDIIDENTEEGMVSSYGGAFYNYGTLNVYGGIFEANHAGRGGAFYNYRTFNLHRATVKNNTASMLGGALYVPNSTAAFTYIGEDSDIVDAEVLFEGIRCRRTLPLQRSHDQEHHLPC